ncbi:10366_t:CDS:2 [Entrophospora sp. SA101]|nr:10366_t:CDS:2 [Entrophospora sp. SA101]
MSIKKHLMLIIEESDLNSLRGLVEELRTENDILKKSLLIAQDNNNDDNREIYHRDNTMSFKYHGIGKRSCCQRPQNLDAVLANLSKSPNCPNCVQYLDPNV